MSEINGISANVAKALESVKKDDAKKDNVKINTLNDEQSKSIFGATQKELETKFDIDNDGKLNAEEQKALDAFKNDKIDKKFDIDGDGKLDDAEKAAANKYKESLKEAELMKKFDVDGNGELDSSEKAAYDAVNYLISIGHRQIGMVSTEVRAPSSVARERGYMRALHDAGIPFDDKYLYRGSYDFSSGGEALEKFMELDRKPTGIFAISDFLAAGVVKKASSLGIKTGRDFSVMGFDNISMAGMYTPSISTVEQPCFKMGVKVVELLIENMNGCSHKGDLILPHSLVLRETTGD